MPLGKPLTLQWEAEKTTVGNPDTFVQKSFYFPRAIYIPHVAGPLNPTESKSLLMPSVVGIINVFKEVGLDTRKVKYCAKTWLLIRLREIAPFIYALTFRIL
jgi:hypothetical protein